MSPDKIVVCRDLGERVMKLLRDREEFEIVSWPHDRVVERPWLLENVAGASGVIVMLSEKVNDELLDAAGPSLKVVSTMSVGFEHVDLSAVYKRKIKVGYTPDVLSDAVADLTVMLALMAGRNVGEGIQIVQSGRWPQTNWSPFLLCGPQISSSPFTPARTIGFIGLGRIALATVRRLIPFGPTRLVFCTSSTYEEADDTQLASLRAEFSTMQIFRVPLMEVASQSDILFVLAPGGSHTHHIIDAAFFSRMKTTAVLVNTSRGTLVDNDALANALQKGHLWGAGLDVVEGEPNISAEHPLVQHPRCIVLPHIGSASTESRLGMATYAAQNAIGGILGESMPAELDVASRV